MKNLKQVEQLLDNYTIEGEKFSYWVEAKDIADCSTGEEATDSMREKIERAVQESSDIIYYSTAMEFLTENDNSLQESMNIAQGLGYEPKDINSELLATLLNEQNNMEQLNEDLQKFATAFDDLEDEDEDEPEEEEED